LRYSGRRRRGECDFCALGFSERTSDVNSLLRSRPWKPSFSTHTISRCIAGTLRLCGITTDALTVAPGLPVSNSTSRCAVAVLAESVPFRTLAFLVRVIDFVAAYDRWIGEQMDNTYDIFMRLTDAGPPLWIETASSLEEAKRRLAALSSKECGTYMVFDWRMRTFIELPGSLPSNPLSTKAGRFLLVNN